MFKHSLFTAVSLPALMLAALSIPAHAEVSEQDFSDLKAQMSQFMQRLNQLEAENKQLEAENKQLKQMVEPVVQQAKAMAAAPAMSAKKDNDVTFKVGGFVKVDMVHDIGMTQSGNAEDSLRFASIPLKGSDADNQGSHTRIHTRQSRVNLSINKNTENGPVKGFIEGDFFGSQGSQTTTNSATFRLREAYVEHAGFLVGQSWSLFRDSAAKPESLDLPAVVGNVLIRQPQIRYTYKTEGPSTYAVSLENSESDFLEGATNTGTTSASDKYLDLIAAYKYENKPGSHISARGVVRQLSAYNDATTKSEDKIGYGLALSGKQMVGKKDDFRFQIAYGDGIGRYIYDLALEEQGAGYSSTSNSLETVEALSGFLGYRHYWNQSLRSNLMAGYVDVWNNPNFLDPDSTNSYIMSTSANLIWNIVKDLDLGVEYVYGRRETESGASGQMNRIITTFKYKF